MGAQQLLVDKPLPLPPQPYTYAYSASRAPGAKPDRYATQEGDANGVVRGQYAYLDPNYQWQQVAYLADADGFHVDASSLPVANVDTPAVAAAKAQPRHCTDKLLSPMHRVFSIPLCLQSCLRTLQQCQRQGHNTRLSLATLLRSTARPQ